MNLINKSLTYSCIRFFLRLLKGYKPSRLIILVNFYIKFESVQHWQEIYRHLLDNVLLENL